MSFGKDGKEWHPTSPNLTWKSGNLIWSRENMVMAVNVFLLCFPRTCYTTVPPQKRSTDRCRLSSRCQEIARFRVLPRRRSRRQKNVKFDGFPLSPWFPIPFWWIWFHVTQQKAGATYCELAFALDTYAQLVEVVGFCHVLKLVPFYSSKD